MKRTLITVAITGLTLTACGGVDRDGTRDNIVEGLAASGIEVSGECVDDALDQYSDDELEAIDEQLDDGDYTGDAEELLNSLLECADAGG